MAVSLCVVSVCLSWYGCLYGCVYVCACVFACSPCKAGHAECAHVCVRIGVCVHTQIHQPPPPCPHAHVRIQMFDKLNLMQKDQQVHASCTLCCCVLPVRSRRARTCHREPKPPTLNSKEDIQSPRSYARKYCITIFCARAHARASARASARARARARACARARARACACARTRVAARFDQLNVCMCLCACVYACLHVCVGPCVCTYITGSWRAHGGAHGTAAAQPRCCHFQVGASQPGMAGRHEGAPARPHQEQWAKQRSQQKTALRYASPFIGLFCSLVGLF